MITGQPRRPPSKSFSSIGSWWDSVMVSRTTSPIGSIWNVTRILRQTAIFFELLDMWCSEGLEQLNRVAGRIFDKDLLASVAGHDLIFV